MANKHSLAVFTKRHITARVKNVGNVRMPMGACAIVTHETDATCLCVYMTASSSATVRQRVLGPVDFTYIEPGEIGSVRLSGRHTRILSIGGFTNGDFLGPSQTVAGYWSGRDTAGSYDGCVIAHEAVAGTDYVQNIRGYVVTWRV